MFCWVSYGMGSFGNNFLTWENILCWWKEDIFIVTKERYFTINSLDYNCKLKYMFLRQLYDKNLIENDDKCNYIDRFET